MLHAAAGPLVTASYFRQPGRSVSRPIALRRVQCQAKTTSSRKTTSSKSSDTAKAARSTVSNATSSGSQQSLSSSTKRPVVVQNKSFWERVEALVSFLTPKQEGDAGDLFMICLSMAVLVYMSMQLYRLYAYAYFSMDHYQTMMDMMK